MRERITAAVHAYALHTACTCRYEPVGIFPEFFDRHASIRKHDAGFGLQIKSIGA